MDGSAQEVSSRAERAAPTGYCEQCRTPFVGKDGKRFCRDACRTRFGRARKARALTELRAILGRATRLLGIVIDGEGADG